MMQQDLCELTVDKLVDLFAANGIEQDQAIFKEQKSKFKKIFGQMFAINAELKRRGPPARLALTKLYEHSNL